MNVCLVRVYREARDELLAAALWYEGECAGLGNDLFDAVDLAVQEVLGWPNAAPLVPGWEGNPVLRAKLVPGFPYRMIYCVTATEIVIFAYAHHRRAAGYWKHRV